VLEVERRFASLLVGAPALSGLPIAPGEIHVICANLSAHKTKGVDDFLTRHPSVQLHYTPTYSSWLNQVELWCSTIERDVIARGVFTSVIDLKRKLMRYRPFAPDRRFRSC
jgi:transposase